LMVSFVTRTRAICGAKAGLRFACVPLL
jgi:hypothetical protein